MGTPHPPNQAPGPTAGVTIYVVDDDASHLRSLSRLLRASGFEVVTYSSAAGFLAELRPDMNGCVITDLMMPEMDGKQLQEALRNLGNTLPLVFLTGHGDIPTSVMAMRGGAEDFLTKNAPKEALLAAVNRALARNQLNQSKKARLQALRAPFDRLTAREREVLSHVVQGKLNKQIASDLNIHERTVKLHRTNLTSKLGVYSVAELTTLVQRAGLFE